ncbi:hypothetical protein [Ruegeria hyattellae]|uniref:hypothetical protein n=1 Tax=Ruegeria hyattellae TaxID=3233337 RepID=UPI00355B53F2
MPGHSNDIPELFEKRMQVIGRISQENTELLRLLQLSGGHDILRMKDPKLTEVNDIQNSTETELAACQSRIDDLELEMARIDEEIETAAEKED